MTSLDVRSRAYDLGELFWEHDRMLLGSLNPAQRQAQILARERLLQHAQKIQRLLAERAVPVGDLEQQAAVDGVADLMQLLLEHARNAETMASPGPLPASRVPIPAPAKIWDPQRPRASASRTPPAADESEPAAMACGRCGLPLVRDAMASAMGRPINQGWRHADGRKTHLPEPVETRMPPT